MITIVKPGLLDTLQDLGRLGYQKYGVVTSGAMDTWSHRIANLLVNNHENTGTIEITLTGPEIHFEKDCLIALCGGEFSPSIDGFPVPMWRPVLIRKNKTLTIGHAKTGCRAYLAVAGGFHTQTLMNSESTYLRAEIGGFKGRALKKNDNLSFGTASKKIPVFSENNTANGALKDFSYTKWFVPAQLIPTMGTHYNIRVTKGRQYELFDPLFISRFFSEPLTITPESDRMGYRLTHSITSSGVTEELISEAVSFGSIQVPPDGQPILLTADRQTTGGYPKIAQVSSCDFSLIAQAKPNDKLTFTEISMDDSQKLYIEKERALLQLKTSVQLKFERK